MNGCFFARYAITVAIVAAVAAGCDSPQSGLPMQRTARSVGPAAKLSDSLYVLEGKRVRSVTTVRLRDRHRNAKL